jgi:hypothetical protein
MLLVVFLFLISSLTIYGYGQMLEEESPYVPYPGESEIETFDNSTNGTSFEPPDN